MNTGDALKVLIDEIEHLRAQVYGRDSRESEQLNEVKQELEPAKKDDKK
jgi:hypothetical protein